MTIPLTEQIAAIGAAAEVLRRSGTDEHARVILALEAAAGTLAHNAPRQSETGQSKHERCPTCNGSGKYWSQLLGTAENCVDCNGAGYFP